MVDHLRENPPAGCAISLPARTLDRIALRTDYCCHPLQCTRPHLKINALRNRFILLEQGLSFSLRPTLRCRPMLFLGKPIQFSPTILFRLYDIGIHGGRKPYWSSCKSSSPRTGSASVLIFCCCSRRSGVPSQAGLEGSYPTNRV